MSLAQRERGLATIIERTREGLRGPDERSLGHDKMLSYNDTVAKRDIVAKRCVCGKRVPAKATACHTCGIELFNFLDSGVLIFPIALDRWPYLSGAERPGTKEHRQLAAVLALGLLQPRAVA